MPAMHHSKQSNIVRCSSALHHIKYATEGPSASDQLHWMLWPCCTTLHIYCFARLFVLFFVLYWAWPNVLCCCSVIWCYAKWFLHLILSAWDQSLQQLHVAAAANVSNAYVSITSIRAGSVVVSTDLITKSTEASAFTAKLTGGTVFSSSTFGEVSVSSVKTDGTATTTTSPPTDNSRAEPGVYLSLQTFCFLAYQQGTQALQLLLHMPDITSCPASCALLAIDCPAPCCALGSLYWYPFHACRQQYHQHADCEPGVFLGSSLTGCLPYSNTGFRVDSSDSN